MDIGFTDEELSQLNESKKPPTTVTRTSRQRSDRATQPSTKHTRNPATGGAKPLAGASLSQTVPANNATKQREFLEQFKNTKPVQQQDNRKNTKPVQQQDNRKNSMVHEDNNNNQLVKSEVSNNGNSEDKPEEETNVEEETKVEEDELPLQQTDQSAADTGSVDARGGGEGNRNTVQQQTTAPTLSKLEELQRAQALLEAVNREKQQELNKTITAKFAKTSEQARLLAELKQEVASLERGMSADISMLRDRIDHCNRRCYDARKRYEGAEQEFVAAKLELHNCRDLKEGLQEHLFTIIKLSETKKSEKLEELDKKLERLNNS